MVINKCRVCKNSFFDVPLLQYKNMPKVAQYLPDSKSVKNDRGVSLRLFQCSGCGLVQLNSDPVAYYKEVIRAAGVSEEMRIFRQSQFSGFVREFSLKDKKVVEIGCGGGEYLELMKRAGVKAYGVEYSRELVRRCFENGLNVTRGFVQDAQYKLKHAPFDAFFILNFLEHLPDPNAVLRGIYNNLNSGAVGIVEVPNFDMMLRDKLFSEIMRDHLLYFTKQSLCLILNLNGFEIVECHEIWHKYIISAIVKKNEKVDISFFYNQQNLLKLEINKFIRNFRPGRVAVWGAGHQALAVIALLDLSDKIKYVVDSAFFKQGKYTPATHIPIVSPEALISDPVDAVIIMAASYSDEVAINVRKNLKKNLKIAILKGSRVVAF